MIGQGGDNFFLGDENETFGWCDCAACQRPSHDVHRGAIRRHTWLHVDPAMRKERLGGFLQFFGHGAYRSRIVDLATKSRLPAIYSLESWVAAGGLMSYGANWPDLFRRAAVYVDKISRGAKPAELPVEQPTKYKLVINLKAANQIGLTMPPSMLYRADKVIK